MGLFSFLQKKPATRDAASQSAQDLPEDRADDSMHGSSQTSAGIPLSELSSDDADRLDARLAKTRSRFTAGLLDFLRGNKLDQNLLEDLEAQLVMSDVSVATATGIVESIRQSAKGDNDDLQSLLRDKLNNLLLPCQQPLEIPDSTTPYVLLVVGVNGAGKTTTIGKIARQLQNGGKTVMLAAGDTFRAAAVEQLKTWGERNNIPVVAQDSGADSASVIFDALQSATAKGIDVLIADTAGRLHTQSGLMDELGKVSRVIKKLDAAAPYETLLVLDGTTGQNALNQAREFGKSVDVSGLVVTKLDGTAKGGVLFTLADELKLPIRFIGVGEGIYDLRVFEAQDFVDALLGDGVPDGSVT